MKPWVKGLAMALWLGLAGSAQAAEGWADAQRMFAGGKYREAALLLEREVGVYPRSADVWFNLGQARFHAGDPGPALAAWEKASLLAPRDPDIRAALEMVRSRVRAPEEPEWVRALGWLSREEWSALWLAATVVFAASWAVGKNRSSAVLGYRVFAGALQLMAGAFWLAAWMATRQRPDAVVVGKEASLLTSPVPQARVVRPVPEGSVFRSGRTFGDWVEWKSEGRVEGWIRRADLVRFRD
jgi:tetratricopeptide (TPR) repeat protein